MHSLINPPFISFWNSDRKDEIAEYLDIEQGMPVILFGCTTYGEVNGQEQPIENFKCYYRTDKYKFYIDQVAR